MMECYRNHAIRINLWGVMATIMYIEMNCETRYSMHWVLMLIKAVNKEMQEKQRGVTISTHSTRTLQPVRTFLPYGSFIGKGK